VQATARALACIDSIATAQSRSGNTVFLKAGDVVVAELAGHVPGLTISFMHKSPEVARP
jgi:hypothetical protein